MWTDTWKRQTLPHRREGEAVLLELLPDNVERVLDLGSGDGRLLRLIKSNRPACTGVGVSTFLKPCSMRLPPTS